MRRIDVDVLLRRWTAGHKSRPRRTVARNMEARNILRCFDTKSRNIVVGSTIKWSYPKPGNIVVRSDIEHDAAPLRTARRTRSTIEEAKEFVYTVVIRQLTLLLPDPSVRTHLIRVSIHINTSYTCVRRRHQARSSESREKWLQCSAKTVLIRRHVTHHPHPHPHRVAR